MQVGGVNSQNSCSQGARLLCIEGARLKLRRGPPACERVVAQAADCMGSTRLQKCGCDTWRPVRRHAEVSKKERGEVPIHGERRRQLQDHFPKLIRHAEGRRVCKALCLLGEAPGLAPSRARWAARARSGHRLRPGGTPPLQIAPWWISPNPLLALLYCTPQPATWRLWNKALTRHARTFKKESSTASTDLRAWPPHPRVQWASALGRPAGAQHSPAATQQQMSCTIHPLSHHA